MGAKNAVSAALLSLVTAAAALPAFSQCPPADELAAAVETIPLEKTARAAVWETPLPPKLLDEAVAHPGSVAVAREGIKGMAVAVMPISREALWKAVNDENGYAEHLGLADSRVIDGVPRSRERLLAQSFRRMGVGRWWVDRVWMSADLYEETGGRIWELVWTDAFDAVDPDKPPVSEVAADLDPVLWTRGAWAFAEIAPGCTLIDYFLWSDPGGLLSGVQGFGIKGSIRDSVEGLVRYAREVVPTLETSASGASREDPPFVRPDGSRLSEPPAQAPSSKPSLEPSSEPSSEPKNRSAPTTRGSSAKS